MFVSLRSLIGDEGAKLHPFLERYCIDCHSADDPSGEREFTSLNLKDSAVRTQIRLQEIIDQITLGNMPPEDGEQPTDKARVLAIRELTSALSRLRARSTSTGGKTVLRRLSRREYRNTVGDLLDIDMTMFDPTQTFPTDRLSDNADNIGKSLVTSGFLLERYLEAADACVEKAFASLRPTEVQDWHFKDYFYQQPELRIAHDRAFKHRYLCLYDHPRNEKPEGAFGPLTALKEGVPADGVYEIRILAEALHRDSPYGEKAISVDLTEPFRMGVRPGDTRIGDMVHTQPIEPKLEEVTVTDNAKKWYTLTVPLDKHFAPRFTFENGHHDVRGAYGRVFRFHRDTLPASVRNGKGIVAQRNAVIKFGQLPQIRIYEVQLRGPLQHVSPRNTRRILLGDQEFSPEAVPMLLESFATRAYRRPASQAEVSGLVRVYKTRLAAGHSPLQAYKDALKAALCTPGFLYLSPPGEADSDQLSSHALAERLSYFLTSSMPDEQLRELADQGTIRNPEVLRQEVKRLLQTDASSRFIADFLDSWLNLRALGSMPPDPASFRVYYAAGLEEEMKQETRLFLKHLIDQNASLLELLRGNYSFVNRDLAKLYGVADRIPVEQAGEFRRVRFPTRRRGGLLGQASILTVSANGIDTSPVIRGVWLLENVLGTPTPPPPDDVPAIDPDVRGATTIREQLVKHRESAACNECHRKIDPLGFALEAFDPIGRERAFYDKRRKLPVDTAGSLANGKSFRDVAELKSLLLEQRDFFVRHVTSRLLSHAVGRPIEATDRAAIDSIIDQVRQQDYPTRDLLLEIVTSDIFQRR